MSSLSLVSIITLFALVFVSQTAVASRAHNAFFQGLTESQKDQISTILHGGLTKAEIQEQIRHWVSSQPQSTQEAFSAAEKAQNSKRMRIQARHQQRSMNLSSPAKELDTQIKEIYQDQTLTMEQTCEKVQALIKSATEEVKKELKLKDLDCDLYDH